jgi:hypothetical protein
MQEDKKIFECSNQICEFARCEFPHPGTKIMICKFLGLDLVFWTSDGLCLAIPYVDGEHEDEIPIPWVDFSITPEQFKLYLTFS